MALTSKFFFVGFAAFLWSATVLHSALQPANANDASTQETKAVPSGLSPMKYFAQNCERCHGPHGVFYGKEFGKNLTDEKLHQFVHDMAAGPGGAPLEGKPLEALVAYHRSLVQKSPFIVVTEWKDGTLRGEATPEAQISVSWQEQTEQKEVSAIRQGDNWSVQLPSSVNIKTVQVTALQGDIKTTMSLPDEYSHRAPQSAKTPTSEENKQASTQGRNQP